MRWILQLINGVRCLHALGIVHGDLRIDNVVFSHDGARLLIIDLEGRWGNRLAPENSGYDNLDAGWTEKSEIYDVGPLIKGMVYGNDAITNAVEWPVPKPLDAFVAACMRHRPEERPSLDELYAMCHLSRPNRVVELNYSHHHKLQSLRGVHAVT